MNRILPIQQFAEAIARRTGYTEEFCREFVMQMFKTVAEGLRESTRVKIKGLGEFVANEAHDDVAFVPDPELAATINEPFSMFEPEELDPAWTPESPQKPKEEALENKPEIPAAPINTVEAPTENVESEAVDEEVAESVDTQIPEDVNVPHDVDVLDVVEEVDVVDDTEAVEHDDDEGKPIVDNSDGQDNGDGADDIEPIVEPEPKVIVKVVREEAPIFSWIPFLCGLAAGLIIGALAVYFLLELKVSEAPATDDATALIEGSTEAILAVDSIAASTPEPTATEAITATTEPISSGVDAVEKPDASKETPTNASTTDVITTTLADLSRKHFNDYRFWVYIFEENKHKFANPDRVERGVEVVIPSKEKYGIDAADPASLRRAEALAREIYAR